MGVLTPVADETFLVMASGRFNGNLIVDGNLNCDGNLLVGTTNVLTALGERQQRLL